MATYRDVTAHFKVQTADSGRDEFRAIALRLCQQWKEWQGEDSLHETAFGDPAVCSLRALSGAIQVSIFNGRDSMAMFSYQKFRLVLSLAITAIAVMACSKRDARSPQQPWSDAARIRFKTIGNGCRGQSTQRPDGTVESRLAFLEIEEDQ